MRLDSFIPLYDPVRSPMVSVRDLSSHFMGMVEYSPFSYA